MSPSHCLRLALPASRNKNKNNKMMIDGKFNFDSIQVKEVYQPEGKWNSKDPAAASKQSLGHMVFVCFNAVFDIDHRNISFRL